MHHHHDTSSIINNAKDWKYIAEGALNLALSYVGNNEQLIGYVLRVRKQNPEATGGERLENPWIDSLQFSEKVILPLLGRRYVQPSVQVHLPDGFIDELAIHIENDRPEKRRIHPLDRNLKTGLLMLDNSKIPQGNGASICFELKVKCGFIPSDCPFVTHDVKKRVDRFTMHQVIKNNTGKLDTLSRYSPLDLFSYDTQRVRRALNALVDTPQNNFRMFLDGVMVYPDIHGHGSQAAFQNALDKIGQQVDTILGMLTDILVNEPLMDRIRIFQQMDDCDIEGTWPVYEQIVGRGDVLESFHNQAILPRVPPKELPTEIQAQHELLKRFMLSCTGKDCSAMITMRHKDDHHPVLARSMRGTPVELEGPRVVTKHKDFAYTCSVVDLDPKPLEKMPHYFKEDRKIAMHYAKCELDGTLP